MRVLIDTDPAMGSLGGDPEDSFALLLALSSPELTVDGITTVQGNVPVDKGYSSAVHLLSIAGRNEVPVYRGAAQPLSPARTPQLRWLEKRAALEQVSPAASPPDGQADAADFMARHVLDSPGEITLITIGPLTNVALALQRAPGFAQSVGRIVMMAGAANVPGNVTPSAEFNIWMDPEAAAEVFASGIEITMVGLDVCEQTHLREELLLELSRSNSPLGQFVGAATLPFIEWRRRVFASDDLHLYDSLAVATAFRPEILTLEPAWVAIETVGRHTSGETVVWLNPVLREGVARNEPNALVGLSLDSDAFETLFEQRVIAPMLE
ncbi:MAG: nucleoside hydrolase [Myxococcota bacterium]